MARGGESSATTAGAIERTHADRRAGGARKVRIDDACLHVFRAFLCAAVCTPHVSDKKTAAGDNLLLIRKLHPHVYARRDAIEACNISPQRQYTAYMSAPFGLYSEQLANSRAHPKSAKKMRARFPQRHSKTRALQGHACVHVAAAACASENALKSRGKMRVIFQLIAHAKKSAIKRPRAAYRF